jgi:hypothetical protein
MLAAKDYLDAIHKCEERIRTNWITFTTLSYGLAFLILNRDQRCWIINWSWQKVGQGKSSWTDPFNALKVGFPASDLKLLDRPAGELKEAAFKDFPPDTLWLLDPKEVVLIAYIIFALFLGRLLGRGYADRHEWLAAATRSDAAADIPMRLLRNWRAELGRSPWLSWGYRVFGYLVVYATAIWGIVSLCEGRTGIWFEDWRLNLRNHGVIAVSCLVFGLVACWEFFHYQATQRRAALAEPRQQPQQVEKH